MINLSEWGLIFYLRSDHGYVPALRHFEYIQYITFADITQESSISSGVILSGHLLTGNIVYLGIH